MIALTAALLLPIVSQMGAHAPPGRFHMHGNLTPRTGEMCVRFLTHEGLPHVSLWQSMGNDIYFDGPVDRVERALKDLGTEFGISVLRSGTEATAAQAWFEFSIAPIRPEPVREFRRRLDEKSLALAAIAPLLHSEDSVQWLRYWLHPYFDSAGRTTEAVEGSLSVSRGGKPLEWQFFWYRGAGEADAVRERTVGDH